MSPYELVSVCLLGALISLVLTPLMAALSTAAGIVDAPDGFRKLHGRIVPLGGGIAVCTAVLATVGFAWMGGHRWLAAAWDQPDVFVGLMASSVLISLLGLIDDRFQLRGRQKLLGQIVLATAVVLAGLRIDVLDVFGVRMELGILAVPFTVFWLLGAVNSLNLIDGVDGLATSVGIILSGMIGVLALMNGHVCEAGVAFVLAGSLAGFLYHNWHPAKIFLGDAGSMFIGFLLGALAIRSSLKGPATAAMIAPTVIWAIPILDSAMAILRRKLTGQSVYATDRGHLHHVLQRHGFGSIGTVVIMTLLSAVCGLGALASAFLKSEAYAAATAGCVVALLVATRLFGDAEVGLLWKRSRSFLGTLIRRHPGPAPSSSAFCSHFHGTQEFQKAWESLVEFSERFDLCHLNLNINAPMLGEVFHAQWKRRSGDGHRRMWASEIPICWRRHVVGRLTLQGIVPEGQSPLSWSSELVEGLRPFEDQIDDILEHAASELPVRIPVSLSEAMLQTARSMGS